MKAPIRGRAENLALIICRDTDKGTSGRRAGSGGGKFGYEIGAHQEHQQEGQGVGGGFAEILGKRKTPCKIGQDVGGSMAVLGMRNGSKKGEKPTLYLYLRHRGHKNKNSKIAVSPYISRLYGYSSMLEKWKKVCKQKPLSVIIKVSNQSNNTTGGFLYSCVRTV